MPSVLVVGSGGREHALVEALRAAPSKPRVLVAPGNAGMARRADAFDVSATDLDGVAQLARDHRVDLVVVGPEAPLVAGLADRLRADGLRVLGPNASAAQLEGSKSFAKNLMDEAGVPTARFGTFDDTEKAIAFARHLGGRAVVKADGLAAGKGVVVPESAEETEDAIRTYLSGAFGGASRTIVVEELLEGEELSVIALSDGERLAVLAPSQDHKRAYDGDQGPNTGGMGAYSPAPRGTEALMREVERTCLLPVINTMARRGTPFSGVLYAGLMLTEQGPKVLEYNVRFGDPETQAILCRLEEDAFELFLEAAEGRLRAAPLRFSDRAAVTVVLASEGYPASSRTGDEILGLDVAESMKDVLVLHAGTKLDGDRVLTAGGRVLGVTGLGDDLESAARTAYGAVAEIRWPGMQYRRDIARRALGRAVG